MTKYVQPLLPWLALLAESTECRTTGSSHLRLYRLNSNIQVWDHGTSRTKGWSGYIFGEQKTIPSGIIIRTEEELRAWVFKALSL